MATRAQIAIFDSPTKIRSHYSHYDGGDYMKKELNNNFNSQDAAEELVGEDYGIRYIQDGEVSRFSDGNKEAELYQNDSTEDLIYDFAGGADEGGADFIHIWKDGWKSIPTKGGIASTAERLMDVLGYKSEELNETEENIMEEGYEAKWAKFLNEAKEMDFSVIRKFIQDDLQRGDQEDPALDAFIDSLQRDFDAGGIRRSEYDDYEMDDFVEDFLQYEADKMDS